MAEESFCRACGWKKPPSDFSPRSQVCKPCSVKRSTAWVLANKAKYNEGVRRSVQKRREYVNKRKDAPCMDCGVRYPPHVMDFDHVRGEKYRNVSLMIGQRATLEKLDAEMDKCDLVCANCHRERTHQRRVARDEAWERESLELVGGA